jgi:hypothetical protein
MTSVNVSYRDATDNYRTTARLIGRDPHLQGRQIVLSGRFIKKVPDNECYQTLLGKLLVRLLFYLFT